ncbi:CU044_2847 family protein [Micromonospora yasonensis]|uniref:CU044_2847 family protein n=1 Tax=Micromonospora yasonensis TaxID=1128667 RepID=UPI00222F4541|nr:CU044_2847 family protein [Micromonospora yasonensis]MCW3839161.1 CU044_2847 family protein [Micromonospora yasonensis]
MLYKLVPLEIDGATVLVEAEELPGSKPTSATSQGARIQGLLDQAELVIEHVARVAIRSSQGLARQAARPSQIEVQFGVKFSAQGNIILARGSGEATLAVKVVYGSAASGGEDDSFPETTSGE